jgi:probable F420-dependent oxidoreductase
MSVRIGLGLANFPFSSARGFRRWVDLCEDSDVDSLWQTDRLISEQPYLESISTMAVLAGATRRLKFGMNVTVVSFRDPLVLAKECATIDYLSEGRLLPAFGVGTANAPEWGATGHEAAGRGARANEALELMARLWSEERVTFRGRYYSCADASISPRPVQKPLPLWIGGSSPAAIRRTARLGTGWIAGIQTPEQVAPVVAAIREASRRAGRPLDDDHYGAGFSFRFGGWDEAVVDRTAALLARFQPGLDPKLYLAVGGAAEILERIRQYREAGVSKFVLRAMGRGDEDLLAQTRRLVDEVLPAVHG